MREKLISILLCLALVVWSVPAPAFAAEPEPVKNLDRLQTIEKLNKLSDGKLKLNVNNGRIFISGKLSQKQTAGENSAAKFLEENKDLFGIDNTADELKAVEINKDELGDTFVKYAQYINGVQVYGNLINVHFNKDGVIVSANGKVEKNRNITVIGNKTITEDDAIEIAKRQFIYKSLRVTPKAERLILSKDGKNYEVFKVNISFTEPTIGNYDIFIEAHSGKVIRIEDNIRYDGPVTGSGVDVQGNIKPLNLYLSNSTYEMGDLTKTATNGIYTYDAQHTTSTGYMVSNTSNYFNDENYKASVSAHYNAGQVIDFYKNLFGRNSLDNKEMEIDSFTHYGENYDNAFWDGNEMVYGDGDGTTYTYLSGDLDIVGHEMTHAVISNTADLQYDDQSGALNESLADTFGVLIETYSRDNAANGGVWSFNPAEWVIGDDVYTPNIKGDAVRSLSNPALYNQPDNMSKYVYSSDNEAGDYGGVHTNSGITNKAAYLIASNIGMEKTARIYYRALTDYMDMSTDFQGAEDCLIQAAADLYGEDCTEAKVVNNAFYSVGIGQPPVDDSYEPNGTIETAYPVNMGTTYQSYISTSTDRDYYKLNVSSAGNIKITLSNLPCDYGLALYDSNGNIAAQSQNEGTAQETIIYNVLTPGSFYVEVYPCSGYSTTQEYSLLVTRPVTGVILNEYSADLKPGNIITLIAAVSPSDATDKNVTWSSSNTSVAVVDNAGNVTAAGEGTAAITVTTSDGGYTASCSLTVLNINAPVISGAADKTIKVGDSFDAKAGVTAADEKDGDLTSKITVMGSVNNTVVGQYTITYYVIDSDGYTASKSVKINVVPRNVQVMPLIGTSRYDTAAKLSQTQFSSAGTVIIVNGEAMADGLGATPLAKFMNAPLLLTGTQSLPDVTINEIRRLNAKKAIIVGGTGVVSSNVWNQLQSLGLTAERVYGSDRYGTSLSVAKYIDQNCYGVSRIVVSNGYGEADALSIASVAGRDNMPIILVGNNNIPTATYNWLKSRNIQDVYIIGGAGVVSDNVLNQIDAIASNDIRNNRLGGRDRFETNSMVIDRFYGSVIDKAYIAKGYVLIDALAAGPVAAINGSPVVLTDSDLSAGQKAVLSKRYGNTIIRTGGGISDTAVNSLAQCLQ